jgi:hypothetical protein
LRAPFVEKSFPQSELWAKEFEKVRGISEKPSIPPQKRPLHLMNRLDVRLHIDIFHEFLVAIRAINLELLVIWQVHLLVYLQALLVVELLRAELAHKLRMSPLDVGVQRLLMRISVVALTTAG